MRKFHQVLMGVALALILGLSAAALVQTPSSATSSTRDSGPKECGAALTVTAPAGATAVTTTLIGGGGSNGANGYVTSSRGTGAAGSQVTATFPISAGQKVTLIGGCAGHGTGSGSGGKGFAVGGNGGTKGGGGGGAAAFCLGSTCTTATGPADLLAVAGGGGGGGESVCINTSGGAGGTAGSGATTSDAGGSGPSGAAGKPGASTGGSGGAGGANSGGFSPAGGAGGSATSGGDSGGGGAGYAGGSGGGDQATGCGGGGGGGGGSVWAAGSATNVKVGSSTGAPCNGSNDALIFTLGGGTEVPVGAIGGLGLAVVAGGGLAAFTVYSRRRRSSEA